MSLIPVNRMVIVLRDKKRLQLWGRDLLRKKFVLMKMYPIAVGDAGKDWETPLGLYYIDDKDRRPSYTYPLSDWVPDDLKGIKIPYGDARNPIAGRWLGLWQGVGIHGTFDRASIGTEASHGCLRMLEEDVKDLFNRVRLGTPVFIY